MAEFLAENATIRYETSADELVACQDVSFRAGTGEFLVIVGPSGCGKTSFLYAVDGLVPLSDGHIAINGRRVSGPGRDRAVVFQSPALFPWRTVMGNVMYGIQRVDGAEARNRAAGLLRLVGLDGFEHRRPHELSGGMQQRANLARALAVDPDLLLLDEPFASLDAQTRERMQAELLRIWRTRNEGGRRLTMLFVTHDISEAVYLADRVIVFSSRPGRVRADIAVDFPRPRELSLKRTAAFQAYVERIWKLLD